jgi:hypothetical protein
MLKKQVRNIAFDKREGIYSLEEEGANKDSTPCRDGGVLDGDIGRILGRGDLNSSSSKVLI